MKKPITAKYCEMIAMRPLDPIPEILQESMLRTFFFLGASAVFQSLHEAVNRDGEEPFTAFKNLQGEVVAEMIRQSVDTLDV